MPADDAPDDDDEQLRQSYNFAPGYHGLIYRAQTSDRGAGERSSSGPDDGAEDGDEPSPKRAKLSSPTSSAPQHEVDGHATREVKYKLQAAKWGLVPFWTKRPADYATQLRTINCRDDSLAASSGMWTTMKQRKRCVVVAEGFYEWLKKNNGKEKIPHFVKRKDGNLMCFAGLWDCVQYEGSDAKLFSYTIITTDPNQQLRFLHDRMPVILEAGSDTMKAWLNPNHVGWDKDLQGMLKPFDGELEVYAVDKAVGKVGNNSPNFVVPINSHQNKQNIANFFGNQAKPTEPTKVKAVTPTAKKQVKSKDKVDSVGLETAQKLEDPESHAPLPKPEHEREAEVEKALIDADAAQAEQKYKRDIPSLSEGSMPKASNEVTQTRKSPKSSSSPLRNAPAVKVKTRSATSNGTVAKTPTKGGNRQITAFFGGQ